MRRRWSAVGLVVGPVAFVAAWAVGSVRRPGYSATHDAISRLAEIGSPERGLMTTGFVAYGVAVATGAVALRESPLRASAAPAAVNGLATIAVAALPLGRSGAGDTAHAAAAVVGYGSLVLTMAAAVRPLRALGAGRAATASAIGAALTAACLLATAYEPTHGAFQRAGLTIGDVWLAAAGVLLLRGDERWSAHRDR